MKKAIILDMDETLESGVFKSDGEKTLYIMTLRPKLNKLVEKLKEIKQNNQADIILCTDATDYWADVLFKKCPNIKGVFDKIYTRNNPEQWEEYNPEQYETEYHLDRRYGEQKPVTTFGYQQLLFIDDNISAGKRLKEIVELKKENNQDISYFSGFGYYSSLKNHLHYKNASKKNHKIAKMYSEYLNFELKDPGIEYMIGVIYDYLEKDFEPGFKNYDLEYKKDFEKYKKGKKEIRNKLEKEISIQENKQAKSYYPTERQVLDIFRANADLVYTPEIERD